MIYCDAPAVEQFRASLLGNLSLVTAPSGSVVSLEETKQHCRIDTNEEDGLIQAYINRATQLCEKLIPGHRQFLTATYETEVACFWEGRLVLPRPPLASLTFLKYYDTTGTLTTLASTYYLVKTPWRAQGSVERAPDQTFPAVQSDRLYPITIRYVAGYGTSASVPVEIKQAIEMCVQLLYDNRGCIPEEGMKAVEWFLETHGYGSYG